MTRSGGSAPPSKPRKDVGSAGRSINRRDAKALPPRGGGRKESRSRIFWRRWRSIFWLGFIGLVLLGSGYFTYPSRNTIVGSSYTSVTVKASKAVDLVGFAIQQAARGAPKLEIGVLVDHSEPPRCKRLSRGGVARRISFQQMSAVGVLPREASRCLAQRNPSNTK
jgi:hypothetical protein